MNLRTLSLLILIQSASCVDQGRSISSIDVKDIVFDLDWTLIKQLKRGENLKGPNILRFEDEYYRLNDGVIDLLKYQIPGMMLGLAFLVVVQKVEISKF